MMVPNKKSKRRFDVIKRSEESWKSGLEVVKRSFGKSTGLRPPKSWNDDERSVEIVLATQARTRVYSPALKRSFDEILLLDGLKNPPKYALLDNHNMDSVNRNLGSVVDLRVENGELLGRAVFSESEKEAYTKVKEGHLDAWSLQYIVRKAYWIPEGESRQVAGRMEQGPVRVVTESIGREGSLCIWQADTNCISRGAPGGGPSEVPEISAQDLDNENLEDLETDMSGRLNETIDGKTKKKDKTKQTTQQQAQNKNKIDDENSAAANDNNGNGSVARSAQDLLSLQNVNQDIAVLIRAERKAERERSNAIRRMAATHGCSEEMVSRALDSDISVQDFGQQVLEEIGKRRTGVPHIEMGWSEGDQYRSDLVDYAMMRWDPSLVEEPTPGAIERSGWSLMQIMHDICMKNGLPRSGSSDEIVGRAASTDDFKDWMKTITERSVISGFSKAAASWGPWVGSGTAKDLNPQEVHQLTGFENMEKVDEYGEYKYTKLSASKEMFQLYKYGRRYKISLEMIINDQMGMLTQVPAKRGEAVARTIADLIYGYLFINPKMADGFRLFSAEHRNIGTPGAELTIDAIEEADQLMANQTDKEGNMLEIEPEFWLGPRALRKRAWEIFGSPVYGTQENPGVKNPYQDMYELIFERRFNRYDPTTWYLASGKGTTVNLYRLAGKTGPTAKFVPDEKHDAWYYKVTDFLGVKAVDWRGLVVHPGSTDALDLINNPPDEEELKKFLKRPMG